MQLSYCPADYDAALAYWIGLGAGPFFERCHIQLENVRYRGEPTAIDFSIALGYFGDLQIEIVRQHNDAPSMFKDWRAEGREGVQHLCVLVDDLTEVRALAQGAGGTVVQEGALPNGAGGVIYVDFGGGPGTIMEYLQIGPAGRAGFAAMQAAHSAWDGLDPIRGPGR
jgi:catechol 2,3-dioxygenase-like lactoylglutathione lyase family enzyme